MAAVRHLEFVVGLRIFGPLSVWSLSLAKFWLKSMQVLYFASFD